MKNDAKIKTYVTKPDLPSLEDFFPYLQKIWSNKILTNGGPFHQELEAKLCEYLGVPFISLFANGTVALITALQALDIKGEVITTPFSFIATSHALLWNGLQPIFIDIDPQSLNLDPKKIEEAITPHTSALLPVHCYGRPCNVEAINQIAQTHNLRVIYDAAHAFGVKYKMQSVLNHGDLSVLSFHATKVFNTFEGGAIVCHTQEMKNRIDQLKNFGITDEVTVVTPGINGKMSEFNSALGLLQLKSIDFLIQKRSEIDHLYRKELEGIKGINCLKIPPETKENYSYFPILIEKDYPLTRDDLHEALKNAGIFSRKYFYPLISSHPMYNQIPSARISNIPNAFKISNSILCLPIYPDLTHSVVRHICQIIEKKSSRTKECAPNTESR